MLMYSIVITMYLPEIWLHPFGAMIKNLPLFCATFVFLILEEERP
jgi:protein-S-isoprenylcysteine O-methyltransferase Ste14